MVLVFSRLMPHSGSKFGPLTVASPHLLLGEAKIPCMSMAGGASL